jgi:hypothetical protein
VRPRGWGCATTAAGRRWLDWSYRGASMNNHDGEVLVAEIDYFRILIPGQLCSVALMLSVSSFIIHVPIVGGFPAWRMLLPDCMSPDLALNVG